VDLLLWFWTIQQIEYTKWTSLRLSHHGSCAATGDVLKRSCSSKEGIVLCLKVLRFVLSQFTISETFKITGSNLYLLRKSNISSKVANQAASNEVCHHHKEVDVDSAESEIHQDKSYITARRYSYRLKLLNMIVRFSLTA